MAEGSRDQGGVSTADPEEDSPNMIVYRKVRPTLRNTTKKDPSGIELGCVFPPPPGGANVSPPVLLTSPPSLSMRVCLTRGLISVEGDRPVRASRLGWAAADILGWRSDRRDARYLPHPSPLPSLPCSTDRWSAISAPAL